MCGVCARFESFMLVAGSVVEIAAQSLVIMWELLMHTCDVAVC